MLFDQRRFKNQRFDFVVGNNELEIGNVFDEGIRLSVERAGAKVGTNAAAEVLGLSDIDHPTRRVFVQIDAGRGWNFFEPFFDCHDIMMQPASILA
jgi:hypothetical protein